MPYTIGIDLCDDYITAYLSEDRILADVPAVICREKKEDTWYIGEAAYRMALNGNGVLTDKLLSLMRKKGTSTIMRKPYTAEQLLAKLISSLVSSLKNGMEDNSSDGLCIALHSPGKEEIEGVINAACAAGFDRERVSVVSHAEAFAFYLVNQDRELYSNMSALFDLSDDTLSCYRLKVVRGTSRNSIVVENEDMEEAFRLGILKKESGSKLADRIMTEAARRWLDGGIYSSVLLTGKGFERTEWAGEFVSFVCRRRKVAYEKGLFAIGAAYAAFKKLHPETRQYLMFCDTTIKAEISMKVAVNERRSKLVLAEAGEAWYGLCSRAEVMPHGQDFVDIDILPIDRTGVPRTVRCSLEGFPERPDRCTRVSVTIAFENASEFVVSIRDLGFGEIYPAADAEVRELVKID